MEHKAIYPIGVVERDTGIGRDTLRVWERRYGFPVPWRNDKGERIYSEQELRRLQRIRRLLDQGLRPGKLLTLSEQALDELEAKLRAGSARPMSEDIQCIIEAVQSADAGLLEDLLRSQLIRLGMRKFILQTVAPLLEAVGELWSQGRIYIYQEHFLSQQLNRFLNIEIAQQQKSAGKPRVLLATLPGEQHTLGLLMLAAVLSAEGIDTINLGGEVPLDQIERAVEQFQVDILAVTFSGAYQYKNIRNHLIELRQQLPDYVDIWAGGGGVRPLRKLPVGVSKFKSLEKLPL